jgi:hypothetical protein
MKKLFNLPSILRVFFGVAQLFTLIGGAFWLGLLLISVAPRTGPIMTLHFPDVYLKTPSALIVIKSPAASAEDIRVTGFATALELNLHSTDRELAAAIRWTLLPHVMLGFIFTWVFFGLLRNLCARVEQGEIFSEANLRSIRNLGILLVSWSLADGFMQFWSACRLGGYLAEHALVTGLNATITGELAPLNRLGFGNLITGLLVLLIAEAFRQGLALKKENDLTV